MASHGEQTAKHRGSASLGKPFVDSPSGLRRLFARPDAGCCYCLSAAPEFLLSASITILTSLDRRIVSIPLSLLLQPCARRLLAYERAPSSTLPHRNPPHAASAGRLYQDFSRSRHAPLLLLVLADTRNSASTIGAQRLNGEQLRQVLSVCSSICRPYSPAPFR